MERIPYNRKLNNLTRTGRYAKIIMFTEHSNVHKLFKTFFLNFI